MRDVTFGYSPLEKSLIEGFSITIEPADYKKRRTSTNRYSKSTRGMPAPCTCWG